MLATVIALIFTFTALLALASLDHSIRRGFAMARTIQAELAEIDGQVYSGQEVLKPMHHGFGHTFAVRTATRPNFTSAIGSRRTRGARAVRPHLAAA